MGDARVVVLVDDVHPRFGEDCCDALEARGVQTSLVRVSAPATGAATRRRAATGPGASVVDAQRLDGGVGGLIDARAVPAADPADPGAAAVVRADIEVLLDAARSLGADLRAAGGRGRGLVATVALGDGQFGLAAPQDANPVGAARSAFLRAAAAEWQIARTAWVDVDRDLADPTGRAIEELDRIAADDPPTAGLHEVGAGRDGRRRLALVAAPTPDEPSAVGPLPDGAVVLAVGGARGITVALLEGLARAVPGLCLVLTGRTVVPARDSEPAGVRAARDRTQIRAALLADARAGDRAATPAAVEQQVDAVVRGRALRDALTRLRAAGADVTYVPLDVRDDDALAQLVADVRAGHGRLDGVVHAAGVVEDRRLADKAPESLGRVIDTKLRPAFTLARTIDPTGLAFCAFFSSLSARFGNVGQADYAAANAALDVLASRLDATWPCRVVAVAWGPWDGGMLAPVLRAAYRRRGLGLIDEPDGVAAFLRELTVGAGSQVLLASDLPALTRSGAS